MKDRSTATGMVTSGMTALGRCQRKSRITSETVTSTSTRVDWRVSIERWMSSDRS